MDDADEVTDRYLQIVKLHVLADKLGVVSLKNDTVRALHDTVLDDNCESLPKVLLVVQYAYSVTMDGSQLRKMLTAIWASHISIRTTRGEGTRERLARVPDFASDLCLAMAERALGDNAEFDCIEIKVENFMEQDKDHDENRQKRAAAEACDGNGDSAAKRQKVWGRGRGGVGLHIARKTSSPLVQNSTYMDGVLAVISTPSNVKSAR